MTLLLVHVGFVRRTTKPLSVGTRVMVPFVFKIESKWKVPPFKTTTLHQPFNYGQQVPLTVRTKARGNPTRPESRQKGEQS